MKSLDVVNGSLQTIATGLVSGGAYLFFNGDPFYGSIAILFGLGVYVIYELIPRR